MPRPYSNTRFSLKSASLATIRSDVEDYLTRCLGSDEPIAFALDKRSYRGATATVRTEGAEHRGGLGGYFEAEMRRRSPDGVERREVLRVGQAATSPSVEVQVAGEVDLDRSEETPESWTGLHELLNGWLQRYRGYSSERLPDRRLGGIEAIASGGQPLHDLVELIGDTRREHAVVVLTKTLRGGRYPIDPELVERWLRPFAYIYVLENRNATFGLSDALAGKEHGCYDGAARLYRPGVQIGAIRGNPYKVNPLLLGEDLAEQLARGTAHDTLFETAQELQLRNFERAGPAFRSERKRLQSMATAAAARGEAYTTASLEEALADARELLDAQASALAEKEQQLARLGDTDESAYASTLADELRSALGAATAVEVWPTALNPSAEVPAERYHAPTVRRALGVLREYAERLAEHEDFRLGFGTYDFFRNRNLAFKANETEHTMGEYGRYRTFQRGDDRREVQSHLTLNPNGDRCVQLYFEADAETRTVHVVYAGSHLPTHTGTHNN